MKILSSLRRKKNKLYYLFKEKILQIIIKNFTDIVTFFSTQSIQNIEGVIINKIE